MYAHNKKKMRAGDGRRRGGWATLDYSSDERTDVNEDFLTTGECAFACSVSSNPRPMRNYTYTRVHCRRVICTKAEAQSV